jgi:hypothetical protein
VSPSPGVGCRGGCQEASHCVAEAGEDQGRSSELVGSVEVPEKVHHRQRACKAVIQVTDRREGHEAVIFRQAVHHLCEVTHGAPVSPL